jgi:SWI/SNF-related matrix-associated actin-dependent regulator 1 of chromatin subfamily A
MGLGKSAISLWYASRNKTVPVVVVCPSSVKWQWQAEVKKVLRWKAHVCESMKSERLSGRVVVINYDILGGWLGALKKLKPSLIILDECQYILNPKAKRTRNVAKLCKGVPHVLALSGTPLVNRPIELFPTLNILQPDIFPSRFSYGLKYCAGKRGHWGWEFKGATKTKELNKLLTDTCMVRRRKEDVLAELPAKIRQVVPVDLRNESTYRAAEEDFIAWLREKDPQAALRAIRAEAVTRAGYLLRLAAQLKCKSVVDWINEWLNDSEGKLIVFAVHRKMIEALQRRITTALVVIDGSVSGKERNTAVQQFQTDTNTRVLIGNVQAAGVGLNLTAASSVVFTELPWQPGAVAQAEDRAHRIGQKQCVNIYYLVARDTVEEKRCRIISRKQEVLSAVLDGGQVKNELDVFDEFAKAMYDGRSD